MTCRELVEFLYGYCANELPPAEQAEFDRHLAVCPACVAYLASYRSTIKLSKDVLQDDDAPLADVPPELIDAILAARRRGT